YTGYEVLPDGHRDAEFGIEVVRGGRREVVIDQVVDDLALDDATEAAGGRRAHRAAFESLVGGVVRTQGIVDLEPRDRRVLRVEVAVHAPHGRGVHLLVQRPERIVEHAVVGQRERG